MTAAPTASGPAATPGQPLSGLRVLDLTAFLSGPYATQILADLGADVVKVEPPGGDASRAIPPHFIGPDSAYYHSVNRNKRSITLDLRQPAGQEVLNELADVTDVVIENFRPGVVDRLGLSYESLSARRPGVVWCSISGFGATGPYRDRPAYDMIVQALSGGMSMTGMPDEPPVRSGIPIGDLSAGMFAVIGVLAAVHERQVTGRGKFVDISMLDCQISMLTYQGAYHLLAGAEPGRQGRGHDSIPTYRAFTGSDDVDVLVTAITEPMWRSLCHELEVPELVDDPRFVDGEARQKHREQLWPLLEKAFARRPGADWLHPLQAAGIPVARVNTVAQALTDEQVRHRNMVAATQPDDNDGESLPVIGNPVKFHGHSETVYRRPPRLGQDSHEVLRDWLGASPQRIEALAGVTRQRRRPEPRVAE